MRDGSRSWRPVSSRRHKTRRSGWTSSVASSGSSRCSRRARDLARGKSAAVDRAVARHRAIIAGTLVLVVRSVAGGYVVDNLVQTDSIRPAVEESWEILTALLRDGALTLVGVGIVLLAGVWLVGPSARATAVRRRLAPWLERPEIAYGAAALALALLVWWGPTAQVRRWQVVLLFAVMLGFGVAALARAARADEGPDAVVDAAEPA